MPQPLPGRASTPKPLVLGIILALVGLGLLIGNFIRAGVGGAGGWLTFAGPGLVFLAIYFCHTRHLGFLIQGAVLTGLGLLFAVERVQVLPQAMPQSAGLFFLFLGLPFLFVWYVHTRHLTDKEQRLWPLYPGVTLTVLAVFFLVVEVALSLRESRWILLVRMWPLLLVLVGLGYILKARAERTPRKRAESAETAPGQSPIPPGRSYSDSAASSEEKDAGK
jgi:hypothetical protein